MKDHHKESAIKVQAVLSQEKSDSFFSIVTRADVLPCISFLLIVFFVFKESVLFHPRSDHWNAIYVFSQVQKDLRSLFDVADFHFVNQRSFRPLSHLILYASYRIFGSAFYIHNLLHLFVFFLLTTSFYFLLKLLKVSKFFSWVFGIQLAVCVTHFDIVSWSYYLYVLTGILCLILSFFLVLYFCRTLNVFWLFLADALVLAGIYFWETFLFFPMILYSGVLINSLSEKVRKMMIRHVIGIYLFYGVSYFVFQNYIPMDSQSTAPPPSELFLQSLNLHHMVNAFKIVVTNLTYVNFLAVFFPWLAIPLQFDGTDLQSHFASGKAIAFMEKLFIPVGIFAAVGLFFLVRTLKKNENGIPARSIFLGLLAFLLSYLTVLSFGRSMTDASSYVYSQFRYQFLPDFIVLTMIALVLNSFWKDEKFRLVHKVALVSFLIFSVSSNFYFTRKSIKSLNWILSSQKIPQAQIWKIRTSGIPLLEQFCKWQSLSPPEEMESMIVWKKSMDQNFGSQAQGNSAQTLNKKLFPAPEMSNQSVGNVSLEQARAECDEIVKKSDLSAKEGRIQASDAWTALGTVYLRANDPKNAEKCFIESLRISSSQTPAYINLGIIYKKMGQKDKAIQCYQMALKIFPDNYMVLNNLGKIYEEKGEQEKAYRYYEKAIAVSPNNPVILKNIERMKGILEKKR